MKYWLLKSEPDAFSYFDLESAPQMRTVWDGVRNYQARNWLRDHCEVGDKVFFYHSSCKTPAIVGICRITRTGVADPSAFDPTSPYFDVRSDPEEPRWITIEVQAECALPQIVTLATIKSVPELSDMALLKQSRLSVQPVSQQEWESICQLGQLNSLT